MEKKIQTIATLRAHSILVNLDDVLLRDGSPARRVKIDHPEAAAVGTLPFGKRDPLRKTVPVCAGERDPGDPRGQAGPH